MQKPKIAVLSYNKLTFFEREIVRILGVLVLFIQEAFTKDGVKSPDNVVFADRQWQKIIANKDTLEHIIIFIGKKDSGSIRMIHRAAEDFEGMREKLYFVSCWHDELEKQALLDHYGIRPSRRYSFKEGTLPCDENVALEGIMRKLAREFRPSRKTN